MKVETKMDNDLFISFRGFLILGRCLGLLPCSGVWKRSYKSLKCSLWSVTTLISVTCILLLAFNAVLAVIDVIRARKTNASQIADFLRNPLFALWGLFIYAYFFIRRQRFIDIFTVWAKCTSSLVYTHKDKWLKWTIVLVSGVMFSSTVLENAVLQLEFFAQFDDINGHNARYGIDQNRNVSIFQMYYWRAHFNWSKIIGNHPVLAVVAFFIHKLVLFGGNYTDVLMALFARALYFRFHVLYKIAKQVLISDSLPPKLLNNIQSKVSSHLDQQAWDQMAKDHASLCELIDVMNRFFSPLIFVSYTVNIYFFCIQLMIALNPEITKTSIVHSIQTPWSFIHVILRIFLVSLSMARVSEYAHKSREIVMRCPAELYSDPIAKLDKLLTVGPKLGFTGLDCFVVTKPFMLSTVNVAFTFEIVLLQGTSPTTSGCPK